LVHLRHIDIFFVLGFGLLKDCLGFELDDGVVGLFATVTAANIFKEIFDSDLL
jgi:hypothetical protein